MTFTEFLTTHCQTSKTTIPVWRPLYDDAAHGKRPAHEPFDDALEMAAYRCLTGEARSQRAAYMLDVLNNTPDPDAAPELQEEVACLHMSARDRTMIFGEDGMVPKEIVPKPQTDDLHLSEREIAEALVAGEDPLALNFTTARYGGPVQGRTDGLLAIAQIAARFGDQKTMDRLLRPSAATVLLCEREEDVAPLQKALLRFRACPITNDFEDPKPDPAATIIDLDRDRLGMCRQRAVQAMSEDPALVVITSDPNYLTGVLAHLRMIHIDAPCVDAVMTALVDVCSATGRMSTAAVHAALPSNSELRLVSREAMLLAFREKGPLRVARKIAALAHQAGGSDAATQRDRNRRAQALSSAAMAVVAHVAEGNTPISIAMTQTTAVVQMQVRDGDQNPIFVSAQIASLLASEALSDILNGSRRAGGATEKEMRRRATRLAHNEATGRSDEPTPYAKPAPADADRVARREKALKQRINQRLAVAQGRAKSHLQRNLAAVDIIAAHLLADGVVEAATLVDLLVMCNRRTG